MELWDKIKQKTTYRVKVDDNLIKERCIKELQAMPRVPKAQIVTKTANINVGKSGISHKETDIKTTAITSEGNKLPDLLRYLIMNALCRSVCT